MKDFDVSSLSDDQLATCVDEYIQRAMRAIHERCEDAASEYASISINAICSNINSAYDITHNVGVGWGTNCTIAGNNVIRDGVTAIDRYLGDKANGVTKVIPMLAYHMDEAWTSQPEDPQIEELDDEIPF